MLTVPRVTLLIVLSIMFGCASDPAGQSVRIFSSGAYAKNNPWGYLTDRYIVWADDQQAAQYVTSQLLKWGFTVLERARLNEVFAEQKLTLMHASEETVLRVGRLAGATNVVFADTKIVPPKIGIDVGYEVSATVRNVRIETGEVMWSGHGWFGGRVANPGSASITATAAAYVNAVCPTRDGYVMVTNSTVGETTVACRKAASISASD